MTEERALKKIFTRYPLTIRILELITGLLWQGLVLLEFMILFNKGV